MNRFAYIQSLFLLGILSAVVVGFLCVGTSVHVPAFDVPAHPHVGHHAETNNPVPCVPAHALFVGMLGQVAPCVPFSVSLSVAFVLLVLALPLAVSRAELPRAIIRISDRVWRYVRFRQSLSWIGQLRVLEDWHVPGGFLAV